MCYISRLPFEGCQQAPGVLSSRLQFNQRGYHNQVNIQTSVSDDTGQADESSSAIDENNSAMPRIIWDVLLIVRYPQLENCLRRVGSCEIIALHAGLELVRLQINEEALLVSATTSTAVEDVSGSKLSFECSVSLSILLDIAEKYRAYWGCNNL